MRRALTLLLVLAFAACSGGTKVPANLPVLPDVAVKAPHAATFTTLSQTSAFYGLTALDGALYGINRFLKSAQCPHYSGCPAIFRIDPQGDVATVALFEAGGYSGVPSSSLVAWRGALYGGGWVSRIIRRSMVYFVDASGSERVVARLPSADWPSTALTASNGLLYGATAKGGRYNRGTVYSVTPDGALRTIYSFKGGSDTSGPTSVVARGGVLYGIGDGQYATCGCASIFALTPSGQERIVYRFSPGVRHGEAPIAPLTFDSAGNIYGAMVPGGAYGGVCGEPSRQCGAIFELGTGAPRFRVLYQFKGGKDGMNPNGGLVLDKSGRIFGTTAWGGILSGSSPLAGYGTIYELTPSGSNYEKTILHAFEGTDGAYPTTGLVPFAGAFYGTTSEGGDTAKACPQGGPQYVAGCGTVFRVVP